MVLDDLDYLNDSSKTGTDSGAWWMLKEAITTQKDDSDRNKTMQKEAKKITKCIQTRMDPPANMHVMGNSGNKPNSQG